MQIIVGTLLDVTHSEREWEGRRWTEYVAHVLDGVQTERVTLQVTRQDGSRNIDPDAVKARSGERVAFETYSKAGGGKRVYLTATKVLTAEDIADALGLAVV